MPARLIVVAQDGSPGRDYPLGTTQTDIGRTDGAILLPNDPYVSPRHARISRRDGRFFLRDLGSVNGVYVGPLEPPDAQVIVHDVKAGRPVLEDKQLARRPVADEEARGPS